MIVKVIQHNNMTNSVNYLYSKMDNKPSITGSHDKYLSNLTAKSFLTQSNALKDTYGLEIGKELERNNNIKHLVVSFHNKDKERFDVVKDKIIEDLHKELGIDPEQHLANIFVHNDKEHPHIHVLFSRVGEGNSVFNDQKIGKRMGEFAKKMNKKYNLYHPEKNNSKITIDKKHLYKPTYKGDLMKLIDYATKEANGLQNFQDILRRHGVRTKINKDSEFIYMIPNVNIPSTEEVAYLIALAKRNTKTQSEFKFYLQKKGVFVKFQPGGKEKFSVKKVISWKEDQLPKACRLNMIYRNIRTKDHDPQYLEVRKILSEGIESCETLGQIKALLPGSDLKFQQSGSELYNITIEYQDMVISLHEVFTKEVTMDLSQHINDTWEIPVIYVPRRYNKDALEWERMQQYKSKKPKMIRFRI
ncbi:MAG: relaxase/mobilization nuclease domain-containing protein [Crocinitomicaceae bacterium]|nr:relaxase/mobilization nuclease domain-containing protein [Crocinitomicaceae bacterium]